MGRPGHLGHLPQPTPPSQQSVQSFDYTALVAASAELQAWVPAKVEAVVQHAESGAALRLRTLAGSAWLHLSWHARYAHVGLGDAPPPRGAAAELYGFGAQLSSTLRGLVLTRVWLPTPYERVLRLAFAQRAGEAEQPEAELVYECMARYSNLLLLGPGGAVAAAAHQVGQRMSSVRHVQVGAAWEPPPQAGGLDPESCTDLEAWRATLCQLAAAAPPGKPMTVQAAAVRAFRGVSPQLARDLAALAGVPPHAAPAELSPEQWGRLHEQWCGWQGRLASGSFSPTACAASGTYSLVGAHQRAVPAPLAFLHAYYTAPQQAEQAGGLKQQLTRAVASAITRLQKKVAALQRQGGEGDKHGATQKLADMVMANVYRIEPGAAAVDVEDWDTGEVVRLPLDTRKTAVEAAEELYKQARKQRRAANQVAPLLAAARAELDYLAEVEVMLAQAEGDGHLAALQEVQADLVAGKYMKAPPDAALADRAASKAATKARRAAKRGGGNGAGGSDLSTTQRDYRRYQSPNGLVVLVGRNSRQNDELTMKVAQPGDVWMHARGVPGAHLVMRVPAGQSAEDGDLSFAADLAAWFSKSRTQGKCDVTVCDPRHISKPNGAKPGQVMVRKERVLVGRPDQSFAARSGEAD
ncbi:Fibronectin-binding A domain [Micractinium conductrix]|uniref:Fibronectin-binding A domain n=1 Tax=Micractinium conductrix TaxID=554055 RepID=A0A2P6V6H5_9CHLO|nr:Fibronectin-binding A domain [Micractinium conductrix]|eukprot:PSC69693.1 Fibronectin-binding A domain [Micractinium conductrix]